MLMEEICRIKSYCKSKLCNSAISPSLAAVITGSGTGRSLLQCSHWLDCLCNREAAVSEHLQAQDNLQARDYFGFGGWNTNSRSAASLPGENDCFCTTALSSFLAFRYQRSVRRCTAVSQSVFTLCNSAVHLWVTVIRGSCGGQTHLLEEQVLNFSGFYFISCTTSLSVKQKVSRRLVLSL